MLFSLSVNGNNREVKCYLESDNWIVQNLNNALETWNSKLSEIWQLLTQSPETFKGGDIWSVMLTIHDALKGIGYGLLVLFFAISVVKTCSSYLDVKKPEHAVKLFIRFALAKGAVGYGLELMMALFSVIQGMVSTIMQNSGFGGDSDVIELPAEMVEKIESVGLLDSIPLWIVTLLGSLFITVLSFIMILTVYGRMFKLYMYTAIAPMESYKHASEEQRNSMRICKIRYFDLEGLPSKEVKEILEAFIWERGKTLALSSLATELTTYNNIRKFLIEKNITVLQNADPEKTVRILKGWMLEKGLALSSMKYRAAYDITARETPALERKLRQILKFAEVKDEREEQEKDIWELEKFEFPIRRNPIKNVKTLNFTDILQPDIREEVKRTIFLHLKYSALGTIHSEMTAVKRFSRFLNVRKPELESLQELSREDIEDYLIYLQTETTERKNYRSDLYGLKRVIEDVGNIYERRHLLQLFLNNDFPSTPRYQFKFYSDATIKRLNSHIFNMDEQIARALIVHQLLGTRISDTLTLRMDCLREKEGRYFVRIDQVKSITYEKAVSNEVGRLILKAMEYTKERYGETEYVFVKKDDPTKPYQYGMIQAQVMRMIRQKDIRDDNGELLKFGTHIFRHCYGKKLTELHIEDWMIARLLGHKTLQSVHHYRRIGNKVMADETRKTREKMDLILMDIIKGWDGYEL